jgi:hypothetical protein
MKNPVFFDCLCDDRGCAVVPGVGSCLGADRDSGHGGPGRDCAGAGGDADAVQGGAEAVVQGPKGVRLPGTGFVCGRALCGVRGVVRCDVAPSGPGVSGFDHAGHLSGFSRPGSPNSKAAAARPRASPWAAWPPSSPSSSTATPTATSTSPPTPSSSPPSPPPPSAKFKTRTRGQACFIVVIGGGVLSFKC